MLVRTRAGYSRHVHRDHPFDVVGWDGCVYPWAFSIHDFEPIVGRIHQPPPVHQTFAGAGFVVCSFVPRLYDFDPDAVKVPYHHANVDSDEVLFYSDGDFMSRAGSGIGVGSISLHPAGFIHGPQPGSRERSESQDRTERAGRDARHVPPARSQRRGPRRQRPRLPLVVGGRERRRGRVGALDLTPPARRQVGRRGQFRCEPIGDVVRRQQQRVDPPTSTEVGHRVGAPDSPWFRASGGTSTRSVKAVPAQSATIAAFRAVGREPFKAKGTS